jgi:hypothetical protein
MSDLIMNEYTSATENTIYTMLYVRSLYLI